MNDNDIVTLDAIEAWVHEQLDDIERRGALKNFDDNDVRFELLKRLVIALGPVALPGILGTVAEYFGYTDEERRIVKDAEQQVIATDEIYQFRSTPPQ